MYPGSIASIISAAANNELAFNESHQGFDDFDYPTSFNKEEIQALYKEQVKGLDMEQLRYLTSFVPFYVKRYLNTDERRFVKQTVEDVRTALKKTRDPVWRDISWKEVVESGV